jgi:selenide,water dikinase
VGILATAQKRDVIEDVHLSAMILQMTTLNSFGEKLAQLEGVTAVTDVTGFGLLGHCIEMADGANLSAELFYSKIPVIAGAKEYISQRIVPDATYRNWNSYSTKTSFEKGVNVMEAFNLLPDPQTNGGLLFSVDIKAVGAVIEMLKQNGLENFIEPIGVFVARKEKAIEVKV